MPLAHSLLLAAAPVVDLDGTFFVQGGIFLLLMLVLTPLLFRPWLAAQQRRSVAIDGALTEADRVEAEATALGEDYDARLAEAREVVARERSQTRRRLEDEQAAELARTREQSNAELERDRIRLQREAAEARTALDGRVDELAQDVVQKLLGRAS